MGAIISVGLDLLLTSKLPPMQQIAERDSQFYEATFLPLPSAPDNYRTVVSIFIDDSFLLQRGEPLRAGTPHGILAEILAKLRPLSPSAILIDVDLTRPDPAGDPDLFQEFSRGGSSPILVPASFTSGALRHCDELDGSHTLPVQSIAGSPFDALFDRTPLRAVHTLLETNIFGEAVGTCRNYPFQPTGSEGERVVPSATAALTHAEDREGAPTLTTRWRVNSITGNAKDARGTQLYYGIPAGLFLGRDADYSILRNAIVIVGSIHQGAGDTHHTPIGDIPGMLIQANLAIDAQLPHPREIPFLWDKLIEASLVFFSAVFTACFVWGPFHRKYEGKRTPSPWQKLGLAMKELFVTTICGGLYFAGLYELGLHYGGLLAAWRFGTLGFLAGTLVALLVETISALSDLAGDKVTEWRG